MLKITRIISIIFLLIMGVLNASSQNNIFILLGVFIAIILFAAVELKECAKVKDKKGAIVFILQMILICLLEVSFYLFDSNLLLTQICCVFCILMLVLSHIRSTISYNKKSRTDEQN